MKRQRIAFGSQLAPRPDLYKGTAVTPCVMPRRDIWGGHSRANAITVVARPVPKALAKGGK